MSNGPVPRDLEAHVRSVIRRWMATYDTSQEDLAARIGQSQVWVSRYLAGKRRCDLNTLAAIATAFGRDLAALLTLPANPKERDLVRMFHAVDKKGQTAVIELLRQMTRATAPRADAPRTKT